jgi:hypothetical protein
LKPSVNKKRRKYHQVKFERGLQMAQTPIYFSDNFFSAGATTIFNENKEEVGTLDLKSAFTSSVDILGLDGTVKTKGYFPLFSRRWTVTDGLDKELGTLRQRFSFFTKKYEYVAHHRGVYEIFSEAFSREFQISDENGNLVSEFKRVNGFFQSPAFQLTNLSECVSNEEWVAVVMGVSMIIKRNNAAASRGGHS